VPTGGENKKLRIKQSRSGTWDKAKLGRTAGESVKVCGRKERGDTGQKSAKKPPGLAILAGSQCEGPGSRMPCARKWESQRGITRKLAFGVEELLLMQKRSY